MAKKGKKAKKAAISDPQQTITIVVPDHIANLDKATLEGIAKLIFGESAKFDISNIVLVSAEQYQAAAKTEAGPDVLWTKIC
jgi:hypothetical protein